jgi:hypothetical protein
MNIPDYHLAMVIRDFLYRKRGLLPSGQKIALRELLIFLCGYPYASGSPSAAGIWLSDGQIRCHGFR